MELGGGEQAIRTEVYPIPEVPQGRLAIMPRPRAGDWLEEEVASWRRSGLDLVVSLLEDHEIAELGLGDEQEFCRGAGLQFLRLPVPDRGVPPSAATVSELVGVLVAELRAGRGVGIHCRIGIGRSSSLAVCVLGTLGVPVELAWAAVRRSRGLAVPDTDSQRVWVAGYLAKIDVSATYPASQRAVSGQLS